MKAEMLKVGTARQRAGAVREKAEKLNAESGGAR
jgi:hypothetical protein